MAAPAPRPRLADWLRAATRALRDAGVAQPGLDARLLLGHAVGADAAALIRRGTEPIGAAEAARGDRLIARRAAGEPVSRILGAREFYGRPFRIGPAVLDPRADTETLVEAALGFLAARAGGPARILDLGTGSGAILLTLLAERAEATGVGTDISAGALAVAAENAAALGLGRRAAFVATRWDAGLEGRFDLVVSNPPYIPTRDIAGLAPEVAGHDPRLALDGGADGLDAYRAIAALAAGRLAPGGRLMVEIGAGQAEAVAGLLAAAGLDAGPPRADMAGRARVIVAAPRPSPGPAPGPATGPGEKPLGNPGRSS